MKITFKNLLENHCHTNNGIQYYKVTDVPFKVGDYVKFTFAGKRHFEDIANKISKVVEIKPRSGNNVVIRLDTHNNTMCCSWVTPLKPIWKRL